jgi:hypothetical protein
MIPHGKQLIFISALLCLFGIYKSRNKARQLPLPNVSVQTPHPDRPPSLAISELPGYTGWARPSSTLAGRFRIQQVQKQVPLAHHDWSLTLVCDNNCPESAQPWFFVRAYGPAILTGSVETIRNNNKNNKMFKVTIHPHLAGFYTLEVVLTYSNPQRIEHFPLTKEQLPPSFYEGYLIPGFPMQITVTDENHKELIEKPFCSHEHLVINSDNDDVWKRASWRILSTNRQPRNFLGDNNNVTLRGYQWGNNSLGFTATYEYITCKLIGSLSEGYNRQCKNKKTLNVIMIGDSVMRLQKDFLEQNLSSDLVNITFVELYGGILRCSRLSGPRVEDLTESLQKSAAEQTVVIFNSGMHDIHRLCGHSWAEDRAEYLTSGEQTLPCTMNYQKAMRELLESVHTIPAAAYIFQTTTAAWPKYGNYGIAWDPRNAQELPLDEAFSKRFNQVAIDEIQRHQANDFHIIDAYWITLARPDNREINQRADIGKKLSHPGYEVISHMVRIWWQATLSILCSTR